MATYSGNDGVVHWGPVGYAITSAQRTSNVTTITTSTNIPWPVPFNVTFVGIQGMGTNPNGTYTITTPIGGGNTISFADPGDDTGAVAQDSSFAYTTASDGVTEVMSFTVNTNMETIDDTVMRDPWRTHKVGLKNWDASVECRWDPDDFQQEFAIGSEVFCIFVPEETAGEDNRSIFGIAKITGITQEQSFDNTIISRSFTLTGNGPRSLTYA